MMASLMLTLWEAGWTPHSPTSWADSQGEEWTMAPGTEKGDPADVIDTVIGDIEKKLWARASAGHLAQGMEHGLDVADAKLTLKKWRKPRPAGTSALPSEQAGRSPQERGAVTEPPRPTRSPALRARKGGAWSTSATAPRPGPSRQA